MRRPPANFARDGYGVLMLEYRGYGGSPGTPTEAGASASMGPPRSIFLRATDDAEPPRALRRVAGSGVAVGLAVEDEIAALILEAPFTSVAEIAQYHYSFVPASVLVRDRFDLLSKIGGVKAPTLVLHGQRDRVVPVRFGRALFEAAPEPKEFWLSREAGHEDLVRFGAFEAVRSFLERWIG